MVFENFNLEQCEDSKSIGNLTIAINLVTACIEAHLLRSSRQERVSKISYLADLIGFSRALEQSQTKFRGKMKFIKFSPQNHFLHFFLNPWDNKHFGKNLCGVKMLVIPWGVKNDFGVEI